MPADCLVWTVLRKCNGEKCGAGRNLVGGLLPDYPSCDKMFIKNNETEGFPWQIKTSFFANGYSFAVLAIKKFYQKNKTNKKPIYLSCIISSFSAKPFTPFAWCEQISAVEAEKRFRIIKKGLSGSNIRTILLSPAFSVVESILSRGGKKVSDAVIEAYKNGAVFDRDKRLFNYNAYKKAFNAVGIDESVELMRRDTSSIMPWENVDVLVSKEYLLGEYDKAKSGIITPDCRMGCKLCGASNNGVCRHGKL